MSPRGRWGRGPAPSNPSRAAVWADGGLQDCHAKDCGRPLSELLGHFWNCKLHAYVPFLALTNLVMYVCVCSVESAEAGCDIVSHHQLILRCCIPPAPVQVWNHGCCTVDTPLCVCVCTYYKDSSVFDNMLSAMTCVRTHILLILPYIT